MRIISWNVRGLGSAAKRRGVRDLLRKQNCDMAILLESKWEVVTQWFMAMVWPGDVFEFAFVPSVGASGGILIVWDSSKFCLEFLDIFPHCAVIKGSWVVDRFSCGVMAVYAPCGLSEQFALWGELSLYLEEREDWAWCVAGDFNAT
ncbi:hypothetical protein V6N13_109545 [Hibiscus sabdariffa]